MNLRGPISTRKEAITGALITFPSRRIDVPGHWPLTPPPPKKPRRLRKPPVSLSDAQLVALLTLAKQYRVRDWVMILVTYWHGLRASETINLSEANFEAQRGYIQVQRGKGSDLTLQALQEHENPLLNEKTAIEHWLAKRRSYGSKGSAVPGSRRSRSALHRMQQSTYKVAFRTFPAAPAERLFPITREQFWRLVHGYALAVGIPRPKAKSHMLKHTIAKHLIRSGLPINEVQAWLGWKSLETANWYLMADEDELGDRVGRAIRGKIGLRQVQQGSLF
ncbi:MAG: tyrosine-type recombinase/integrase [Terriglobales bacterium]